MLAALLATTAACSVSVGGDEKLDTAEIEQAVAEGLATPDGPRVEEVRCPDDVELSAGDRFACTAVIEGLDVEIEVTQEDDEGSVRWERVQAVLDLETARAVIADGFAGDVEVDCGGEAFAVAEPGDRLECRVTDAAGSVVVVTMTVSDVEGNVELEVTG